MNWVNYATIIQQESVANYQHKQVKSMEDHASRDLKSANVLYREAVSAHDAGNEQDSIDYCSDAGQLYGKSIEKYSKANLVAQGIVNPSDLSKKDEDLLNTHRISWLSSTLGSHALLDKRESKKVDRPINDSNLGYIGLSYGSSKGETYSLSLDQATELKELAEKAEKNYNYQKMLSQPHPMVVFLDNYLDTILS
jgi:hypothetical protein